MDALTTFANSVSDVREQIAHLEGRSYEDARTNLFHAEAQLETEDGTDGSLEYVNEAIGLLMDRGLSDWTSPFATRQAAVALRAAATLLTGLAILAEETAEGC